MTQLEGSAHAPALHHAGAPLHMSQVFNVAANFAHRVFVVPMQLKISSAAPISAPAQTEGSRAGCTTGQSHLRRPAAPAPQSAPAAAGWRAAAHHLLLMVPAAAGWQQVDPAAAGELLRHVQLHRCQGAERRRQQQLRDCSRLGALPHQTPPAKKSAMLGAPSWQSS